MVQSSPFCRSTASDPQPLIFMFSQTVLTQDVDSPSQVPQTLAWSESRQMEMSVTVEA